MIGYIALGICFFIFGYQYVVRRKRDQQLLVKSMDWHRENFNRFAEQEQMRQDEWNRAFDTIKLLNERARQERRAGRNPGF